MFKGALPLIQQLQHHRIYTRPVVRWNPWTKTIESHLHLKLHRGHHVERRSTKGRHFPMIKPLHSSLTLEINLQKFSFFFNFKCLKKSSPFVFSPANSPRMKIKLSVKPISEQLQTQELFCFSFPPSRKLFFKKEVPHRKKVAASIGKGGLKVWLGDNVIGRAGGHVCWSSLGARKEWTCTHGKREKKEGKEEGPFFGSERRQRRLTLRRAGGSRKENPL